MTHKVTLIRRKGHDAEWEYRGFGIHRMEAMVPRDDKPPAKIVIWQVTVEGKIVASSNPDVASQCVESLSRDSYQGCKALIDRLLKP